MMSRGTAGGVVGGMRDAPPPPPPPPGAVERRDGRGRCGRRERPRRAVRYKLKQPVTIRRTSPRWCRWCRPTSPSSACSLWHAGRGVAQPLRAIWLTNDTGLTLDGGAVTLVEGCLRRRRAVDAIQAGRAALRLLCDRSRRARHRGAAGERGRVSRVRIASSVMNAVGRGARFDALHRAQRRRHAARRGDRHPVRAGWTLTGGVKPAESSPTAHRFRIAVAPKSTATLTVAEMHAIDSRVAVRHITDERYRADPARAQRRRRVEPHCARSWRKSPTCRGRARIGTLVEDRQAEVGRIGEDQDRIRENLRRPQGQRRRKGAHRALQPKQLATQEDLGLEALHVRRSKRPRPIARRSSRTCRGSSRALSLDIELPRARLHTDASDPLRRLPDFAAHLATALAGPLPGARIQTPVAAAARRLAAGRTPAASGRPWCSILLFPRDDVPHVVLTVRGAGLPHHADQIPLPGGRPEPGETAEDTVPREAVEEIGVDVTGFTIAGRLTPSTSRSAASRSSRSSRSPTACRCSCRRRARSPPSSKCRWPLLADPATLRSGRRARGVDRD